MVSKSNAREVQNPSASTNFASRKVSGAALGSDPNSLCHTSEHSHQMALFCACTLYQDSIPELRWYHAIPNGGDRNIIVAGNLKAEGVKSGISDTFLPVARRGYFGFYIEMKKPGGTESSTQAEYGRFVQQQGYLYLCADHWAKAFRALMWYLDFPHIQSWSLPAF
jgi:hypothetical protein